MPIFHYMSGIGRRRILLVEDDEDLVVCLQAVLEEEGYFVLSARDGETALDLCRFAPSLALVDLNIDGAPTGSELIAELRQRLPPGTHVCLLSGERDLARHALELRADAWIEKPFDVDDLLRVVVRELAASDQGHAPHP